jgi:hypothetical protein
MKPWYEITTPRPMIRSGYISESTFIADLLDIVHGEAPPNYQDPQLFFKSTYLTKGLYNLLVDVKGKLYEGQGSSIIKLQTAFGGGKTHALIVIYHYVKHGDKIAEYLPNIAPINAKIATIGGTHLNPIEGKKNDNVHIHTIWGDIAFQLGGLNGYKEFETNDINRISPGKEKIKKFLLKHEPFLLLIDELVEYLNKALGISINESNLGTQTLSFIQELTEALVTITRGLLVITLPFHQYEDYSETTRNTLDQVNHILGRLETTETPIEREEFYPLVTKRLIEEVISNEERDKIISHYIQLYRSHRTDFPERIMSPDYVNRMKEAYPFHPEFLDLLFDNWRTFPTFQGTRAILRILSRVLSHLWSSKEQLDLITPSDVPFQNAPIRNEFLQHLDSQYTHILNEEMLGSLSRVGILDQQHPEWDELASKVSKSIFLASFTKNEDLKGIALPTLRIYLIRPDFHISLIHEIVNHIHKNLWYIHFQKSRFFFSQTPNLNHEIENLKLVFQEKYDLYLQKEIEKHLGIDIETTLWPSSSKDIPDNQNFKIIIIHPSTDYKRLEEWFQRKGKTFRLNKNTMIFALPKRSHLAPLRDIILTKLSLNELKKKMIRKSKTESHVYGPEILDRLEKINNSMSYNIRRLYSILYDGTREIPLGFPSTERESLTKWYKRELFNQEFIVSKLHHKKLIELFLGSQPFYHTNKILEQFYINPNIFKIEKPQVIQESICRGVEKGSFGISTMIQDKIQLKDFKFSNPITPEEITFSSNEVLLSNKMASAIVDKLKRDSRLINIMVTETFDEESKIPLRQISTVVDTPQETRSLKFVVHGLKSKFLPEFYQGVLFPLEAINAKISLEIKICLKTEQEIPESVINTKIKETISQLGAHITTVETKS